MKYIIDVPEKWVNEDNELHIPIETGWYVGNFRIETGLKVLPCSDDDFDLEFADYMKKQLTELCNYNNSDAKRLYYQCKASNLISKVLKELDPDKHGKFLRELIRECRDILEG